MPRQGTSAFLLGPDPIQTLLHQAGSENVQPPAHAAAGALTRILNTSKVAARSSTYFREGKEASS
jgi:hypothetical protein